MASVSASMAATGERRSDQGQVWADIDMKLSRMHMMSQTSAMADIYEAFNSTLHDYIEAFETETAQIGAFFCLGDVLVGFDIFDKPATFSRLFKKLLRSYAIEAVENPTKATAAASVKKAKALLVELATADWSSYAATGLGTDHRYQSSSVTAASLVVDNTVVHASAFLLRTNQVNPMETGMASLRRRRRLRTR